MKELQIKRPLSAYGEELEWQFLNSMPDYGCTCFINPPCSYCTHPGNPISLEEDDDAWSTELVIDTLDSTTFKYMVGHFDYHPFNKMTEWNTQQFGLYTSAHNFNESARWYRGSSYFIFKQEKDRDWFLLRWPG